MPISSKTINLGVGVTILIIIFIILACISVSTATYVSIKTYRNVMPQVRENIKRFREMNAS